MARKKSRKSTAAATAAGGKRRPRSTTSCSYCQGDGHARPWCPRLLRNNCLPQKPSAFQPLGKVTIDEWDRLEAICQRHSFRIINLPSISGDCLFVAVKHGLALPQEIPDMRRQVVHWLRNNLQPGQWAPSGEDANQDFQQYLTAMERHAYGDEYVLTAMAKLYNMKYVIVLPGGVIDPAERAQEGVLFLGYLPNVKHYVLLEVSTFLL